MTSIPNPLLFEKVRPRLIENAYVDFINGHDFGNVEFRAYSGQQRSGRRCSPRKLNAREAVLDAASPRLRGAFMLYRSEHL